MAERFDYLLGKLIIEPKKTKRKAPERDVGLQVDAYLRSIGAYMRTINSGGRKLPNGKWIAGNQGRGISDRCGVLPGGRFLAVELKAEGKRNTATSEQLDFLTKVINLGGLGVVADSVECVKQALLMSKEELLKFLPQPKKDTSPLFEEELF